VRFQITLGQLAVVIGLVAGPVASYYALHEQVAVQQAKIDLLMAAKDKSDREFEEQHGLIIHLLTETQSWRKGKIK
jgi:hypothetical protein